MFFDFLKRKSRVVDVKVDGDRGAVEKKNKWLIWIIIAAIMVLAFGSCENVNKTSKESVPDQAISDNEEYMAGVEERLEEILSDIKGAGVVKVMVSFETKEEKVLASDKKNSNETEVSDNGSSGKTSGEENILLYGSGSDEKPYVIKEKLPVPTGVFVTASGASSENVRLEIYEAIKALYGISGHRIKVSPSK